MFVRATMGAAEGWLNLAQVRAVINPVGTSTTYTIVFHDGTLQTDVEIDSVELLRVFSIYGSYYTRQPLPPPLLAKKDAT